MKDSMYKKMNASLEDYAVLSSRRVEILVRMEEIESMPKITEIQKREMSELTQELAGIDGQLANWEIEKPNTNPPEQKKPSRLRSLANKLGLGKEE